MTAVNGRLAGAALQPETQAAAPTRVLLHTKLHTTSLLLLAAGLQQNSAAAFFCHPTPAVCTVPIVQQGLHCFGRFLPSRPLIGVRFPIGNNDGRVSKALMETKR